MTDKFDVEAGLLSFRWADCERHLLSLGFTPAHVSVEVAATAANRWCKAPHDRPSQRLVAILMAGTVDGAPSRYVFHVAPCCGQVTRWGRLARNGGRDLKNRRQGSERASGCRHPRVQ